MVKRYEPAPGGGMMERDGGKYFHERDVDEMIEKAIDACFSGVIGCRNAVAARKRIIAKEMKGWKDESV